MDHGICCHRVQRSCNAFNLRDVGGLTVGFLHTSEHALTKVKISY